MSDELKLIPFNPPVLLLPSPCEQSDRFARLIHACRECDIEVQMIRKDGTVTILRAGQPMVRIHPDGVVQQVVLPTDHTRH